MVDLDRLVPAGDVIDTLASEHDRRGTYGSWQVCQSVALETLLARLKDGHLEAWTTTCSIDSSPFDDKNIISTWDFHRSEEPPAKVPREFWCHFHYAGEDYRNCDLVTGDFRFNYVGSEYSSREGSAYAVHFDHKGLPTLTIPNWQAPGVSLNSAPPVGQAGKGRKPANWWAAFAEELVVYHHECGIPEGAGADGQSEVIDAVFSRMTARGLPEPSRTTVQPVVSGLLRRIRSAGN